MARTTISKAAKNFNISVQTAVEFLRKKNISIEDNPNARIDEDVYDMLAMEFKPDQALKTRSERQTMDRRKEQAPAPAAPATTSGTVEEVTTHRQTPRVLGKIDLRTGKPIVETPNPPRRPRRLSTPRSLLRLRLPKPSPKRPRRPQLPRLKSLTHRLSRPNPGSRKRLRPRSRPRRQLPLPLPPLLNLRHLLPPRLMLPRQRQRRFRRWLPQKLSPRPLPK